MQLVLKMDLQDASTRVVAFRSILESIVVVNKAYLRQNASTPRLYRSGVVYRDEPLGYESFVDIPHVLRAGWGDCAHLCAWRVAELQLRGLQASIDVCSQRSMRVRGVETPVYHIRVRLPDGRIEDPSQYLTPGYPLRVPESSTLASIGPLARLSKRR